MASRDLSEPIKRKYEADNDDNDADEGRHKPMCKYGLKCYRKNPIHLKEFSHPTDSASLASSTSPSSSSSSSSSQSVKRARLDTPKKVTQLSHTQGFYFTTVQGIEDVYNDSSIALSIKDILSDQVDNLLESVQEKGPSQNVDVKNQFNYCIDLPWLVNKYPQKSREKPLTIVHGSTGKSLTDLQADAMKYNHISLVQEKGTSQDVDGKNQAKLPIAYGTHHTKMMILFYTCGVRLVIHTANLIQQDWCQKTQGIWRSPLFPSVGEGYNLKDDYFKMSLLEYLNAYTNTRLKAFASKLQKYDMTNANVHLIASVPGRHKLGDEKKWGHLKLRKTLREFGPSTDMILPQWPVVGQFSSIGSLGADSSNWLTAEFLDSLTMCRGGKKYGRKLNLIFPTMENVRNSLEGYSAGGSIPYSVQTAMKQRYLKEHLQASHLLSTSLVTFHRKRCYLKTITSKFSEWKANCTGRSLASPHIKSYARISEDCKHAAWFLLTSANLSKAAWGVYEKNQTQLMIRSYEIGVLFLPMQKDNNTENLFSLEQDDDKEYLQLPFDVPLTPYSSTDKPWVWDIRYTKEDSHGRLWVPT